MAYTDELRDAGCIVVADNDTILRIRESLHRDAAIYYDEDAQNWVVEVGGKYWPPRSLGSVARITRMRSTMPDPKLRDYIPALTCILGMILFVTGGGVCIELWQLRPIPALVALAGLALMTLSTKVEGGQ